MPIAVKQWGSVVTDFLKEIGSAAETRVLRQIRKLAAQGHGMRTDSKPLGDGIFELVISFNKMEYRVAYVFHDGCAVLLHPFIKKKQKTPKPDLEIARERYKQLVVEDARLKNVEYH